MIDRELSDAAKDLRQTLEDVPIPPFEPKKGSRVNPGATLVSAVDLDPTTEPDPTGQPNPGVQPHPAIQRRSARLVVVAASMVLFVAGLAALVQVSKNQETDDGIASGSSLTNQPGQDPTTEPTELGDNGLKDDLTWVNGVEGTQQLPATDLTKPTPAQPALDPTFNTTIRAASRGDDDGVSLIPLQVRPAWNADGSYLLLYRSGTGHVLADGQTLTEGKALDFNPADIEQVYWHPTDPELLFFVDNSDENAIQLKSLHIKTDEVLTIHTYQGCSQVDGMDSDRISAETLLLGQLCTRPEGNLIVSVSVVDGKTVQEPADGLGAPQPTPSSDRYVARTEDGDVRVLDDQLKPTGIEFSIGNDAAVVIETAEGKDLLVTTIFSGDEDEIGSVVAFDLDDATSTVIVGPATGYPFPPPMAGLTTSVTNDGRVTLATGWDSSGSTLSGEILVVDFDQPSPTVKRIVHHRSTTQEATDKTWSQVYPALHPQQSAVAFASDWGGPIAETYVVTDKATS